MQNEAVSEDVGECGCGTAALLPYVAEEHRKDFFRYVNEVIEHDDYEFDHQFLGFISDYAHYAAILNRKADLHAMTPPWDKKRAPLTVYDVGCSNALQHLMFDPRIRYVGIDMIGEPGPRFFRDNCRFVKGRFSDVLPSLKVDPHNSIGIANMSLLYFMADDDALTLFDRTFRQKFVL